ncbi:MAG: hypothetical protein MJZ78_03475 [Bacteroidales bacterium]|nr:hypothetical protein [Bacteroidales bacterium]
MRIVFYVLYFVSTTNHTNLTNAYVGISSVYAVTCRFRDLEIWSNDYFLTLADRIRFV